MGEPSPGQMAFHLLNERLTDAVDQVLDAVSLEQLLEAVNRAAGSGHGMYYI